MTWTLVVFLIAQTSGSVHTSVVKFPMGSWNTCTEARDMLLNKNSVWESTRFEAFCVETKDANND